MGTGGAGGGRGVGDRGMIVSIYNGLFDFVISIGSLGTVFSRVISICSDAFVFFCVALYVAPESYVVQLGRKRQNCTV